MSNTYIEIGQPQSDPLPSPPTPTPATPPPPLSASSTTHIPLSHRATFDAGLVGLEPVLDIVKTIMYGGAVAGERPNSLIISAPIGCGKTTVLEKTEFNTSHFFSDFTAREAQIIVEKEDILTHIAIGDFLSVFNHKSGTAALSLNLLAKLTGETLRDNPWNGKPIKRRNGEKGISVGVLTAIPPERLRDPKIKTVVYGDGFASRFLILSYTYKPQTMARIHKYIESDAYINCKPLFIDIPRNKYPVTIPANVSAAITVIADKIKHDKVGFRANHHLRALVKARARYHDVDVVTEQIFGEIYDVIDFFYERGRAI